jgi:hypothetical protein
VIVVLPMTSDDHQRLDEILKCRTGDFVLHRRLADEDFLVRFQCVEDQLADIVAVVDLKETHE